ncbi:DNA-methyltransferase [Methylorubrum populi]
MLSGFREVVQIGSATLIRADSLDVLAALAPGSIGGVLADPPYSSGGLHAGDRARAPSQKYQSSEHRHLHADFAGDTRDQRSFLAWSGLWMDRARLAMRPGAILAAFTDWRQLPITTDAIQVGGFVWRGIVPWDKTEAVRPQLGRYRAQAEYLVWGTNGPRPMAGPIVPGAFRYAVPKVKRHMAAKPVELMRDLLRVMDGPILDPFMGSASIGEACAELGLPYIGVEVSSHYFDVACQRLEDYRSRSARRAIK